MSPLTAPAVSTMMPDWYVDTVIGVTPMELVAILIGINRPTFIGTVEVFDMLEPKRMNKTGNPFIGSPDGLFKVSRKQLTANFASYEAKRELRADAGETVAERTHRGTWHTALIVGGDVTPLSIHKGDVVTRLAAAGDAGVILVDGKVKDCIANQRAILDADGNIQPITADPRLYLRYEIVRAAGDDPRPERRMKAESRYFTGKGEAISTDDVTPYLPKPQRHDGTDVQLTGLENLRTLAIDGKVYAVLSMIGR